MVVGDATTFTSFLLFRFPKCLAHLVLFVLFFQIVVGHSVSYKGNTGDDRESPAYEIIAKLSTNYEISIHDPHLNNPNFSSLDDATKNADLILILCDHNEFKHPDYELINKKMASPIIFDTKNIILSTD